MRMIVRVSIEVPEGCEREDVGNYVYEAVRTFSGSFLPPGEHGIDDAGDPLWGIGKTVKVSFTQRGTPTTIHNGIIKYSIGG